MFKYSRFLVCMFIPLSVYSCDSSSISDQDHSSNQFPSTGDSGDESAFADSVNLDIGGSELVYAPFCQEEPFKSNNTGTYRGTIANEIFSEFSRCEFDITLTIESSGADNQSCEQAGVLSFTGTQTVSSEFSGVCGSVEQQEVTIGWDLQENTFLSADGLQLELVSELEFPIEAFVSSWGIELLPDENDNGIQIEYPGVLFSLQLNKDLTISGGDSELYSGLLRKNE